ncbi:MAG: hypothetical protein RLN60_03420 [Phycisphaerales bacterium]
MDDRNAPISANDHRSGSLPIHTPVWLSVEQIRKRNRCRRQRVIDAMISGALPFEQRGRIRYARLCDIIAWEESRLQVGDTPITRFVDPDLADLI